MSFTALRTVASIITVLAFRTVLAEEAHWQYGRGHGGPAHWGELSSEYATCGVGKLQSPIDIQRARKAALPPIRFDYQPGTPKVVNNGHTIQVTPPPGSSIAVGDHRYDLLQFHFHAPSEEAISGKRAPLVAHLVHRDADGKLAVVAVLFDVGPRNAALDPVFAHLPAEPHTEVTLDDVELDPGGMLPAKRGYYEFEGSLTTPPCTEGVRWLVLQRHSTVSQEELAAFRKLYPDNARPLQPLNGRTVRSSM